MAPERWNHVQSPTTRLMVAIERTQPQLTTSSRFVLVRVARSWRSNTCMRCFIWIGRARVHRDGWRARWEFLVCACERGGGVPGELL